MPRLNVRCLSMVGTCQCQGSMFAVCLWLEHANAKAQCSHALLTVHSKCTDLEMLSLDTTIGTFCVTLCTTTNQCHVFVLPCVSIRVHERIM